MTIIQAILFAWLMSGLGFVVGIWWRGFRRPHERWQHSFLTGMLSIFHEGESAYNRGLRVTDNPYRAAAMGAPWTPEARSWQFGFLWNEEHRVPREVS